MVYIWWNTKDGSWKLGVEPNYEHVIHSPQISCGLFFALYNIFIEQEIDRGTTKGIAPPVPK